MTHDWLLVETLGTEPTVVAQGHSTKNLIPVGDYLRRDPHLMAIQTAIGVTVRGGQPLSSITPKHDSVIRTEVVQMTDGKVHGVHLWLGPPDVEPPTRFLPGPLKWDLKRGVATDTPESLFNIGRDPSAEATHGRAFAEDLPSRELTHNEAKVLAVAIKPELGEAFCSSWHVANLEGRPITVGIVGRIMREDGGLICRAMNWPSDRDESTVIADGIGQAMLSGSAQPGVHRALVNMQTWTLLKWLDEPCPFYDWRANEMGNPAVHPDDVAVTAAMLEEFERGAAAGVLRLRSLGGGFTPVHVSAHPVELREGVFAALLSLRLPTEDEVIASEAAASKTAKARTRKVKLGKKSKDAKQAHAPEAPAPEAPEVSETVSAQP